MRGIRLTDVEKKFAELLWENTPMSSREMVEMAADQLNWKKSTAYTVLRFLCNKGLFTNEGKIVSTVMTKEEYYLQLGEDFLKEAYDGTLSAFVAAFIDSNKLSPEESEELLRLAKENVKAKAKAKK